jgi:hypothetical protein
MTVFAHYPTLPTRPTLGMRWLVLLVIAIGMIVSSIGFASSHGIAAIASADESVQNFAANSHAHVHSDQANEISEAVESSNGEHAHHGMDHSHDTAHHPPETWGAVSSQLPSWELMVWPWIEMGQAYRLDRPPMG